MLIGFVWIHLKRRLEDDKNAIVPTGDGQISDQPTHGDDTHDDDESDEIDDQRISPTLIPPAPVAEDDDDENSQDAVDDDAIVLPLAGSTIPPSENDLVSGFTGSIALDRKTGVIAFCLFLFPSLHAQNFA